MNKKSSVWNDCPLCGKMLSRSFDDLICMNDNYNERYHYSISFNINQILFETVRLENGILIYRDSESYKENNDNTTITTTIRYRNNILYESDKLLTIDQVKKLIPLL